MRKTALLALPLAFASSLAIANSCPKEMKAIDAARGPGSGGFHHDVAFASDEFRAEDVGDYDGLFAAGGQQWNE